MESIILEYKLEYHPGLDLPDGMEVREVREIFWIDGDAEKETLAKLLNTKGVRELCSEEKDGFWITKRLQSGVTDNLGNVAREFVNTHLGANKVRTIRSGKKILIDNQLDYKTIKEQLKDRFYNPQVEEISFKSYISNATHVILKTHEREIISLDCLESEGNKRGWGFYPEDIQAIQKQFASKTFKNWRKDNGMPELPTLLEIECLAQTWSEHCKHRLFNAKIIDDDTEEVIEDGVFQQFIKHPTGQILEDRNSELKCLSVFDDNAGIWNIHPDYNLCIKVETHNSPSALDPYGGAITGILGVNRDILGAGMGAFPIANLDVFCVGVPRQNELYQDAWPVGHIPPEQILKGIHSGVKDGGNKSGVPTVNGSIYFDPHFGGKPLVFCGTIGISPAQTSGGHFTHIKRTQKGDLIYMLGGQVGKDGLHGATMSSVDMDEKASSSIVQIGDPFTQKRVKDFLKLALEQELYTGITDNGAGGLSSSVGEMATLTGGASLYLEKVPLKYEGLAPWEILLSESQERMTLSVHPSRKKDLEELCKSFRIEAAEIGFFHDRGVLEIYYGEEKRGWLDLDFLHKGAPQLVIHASHKKDFHRRAKEFIHLKERLSTKSPLEIWGKVLSHPNVASKEKWVSQYDQEVQGITSKRPYEGLYGLSPSDAGVLNIGELWGEDFFGVGVSHGMGVQYIEKNPFYCAYYAVDEALRNLLCSGANPERVVLTDNFCWPNPIESSDNPEGKWRAHQLLESCKGMKEACLEFGAPLISGKDSMKNDYFGKNKKGEDCKISVLPTLLITAAGEVTQDLRLSAFDTKGHKIALLAWDEKAYGLSCSIFSKLFEYEDEDELCLAKPGLRDFYQTIYQNLENHKLKTLHDISEGGVATALFESCLAYNMGCSINKEMSDYSFWFSEGIGHFLCSFCSSDEKSLKKVFGEKLYIFGEVINRPEICFLKAESMSLAKGRSFYES